MGVAIRSLAVILTALVLQVSLVADVVILGARGDLLVLVAVVAGLVGGPQRGAVVGFVAGLLFDLLLATPLGLSALAYCLTGYVVGSASNAVLRPAWWVTILTAAAGCAFGVGLFFALGSAADEVHVDLGDLPAVLAVTAGWGVVLGRPAAWAMRWAFDARHHGQDRFLADLGPRRGYSSSRDDWANLIS